MLELSDMKNMIKTISAATFVLLSQLALATPEHFSQIKSTIDRLENSIIQDFSIDTPVNRKVLTPKDHAKLAGQIEVKYGIQKTLFYKLEEKFFNLNSSLTSKVNSGDLSQEEAEKLKNSIEYANRIILKSRKAEINQIYSEFMAGLNHTPKLTDIYAKLKEMDVKNCSLSNLEMNTDLGVLSFNIKKKNKFGSWTSSNFKISNNDIESGHLTSKLDNQDKFNPFHNIITQYWNISKVNSGHQKFTLLQDENGTIKEANFNQESEIPLVSFLGMNFGTQKIKKNFNCESKKGRSGPIPASVRN